MAENINIQTGIYNYLASRTDLKGQGEEVILSAIREAGFTEEEITTARNTISAFGYGYSQIGSKGLSVEINTIYDEDTPHVFDDIEIFEDEAGNNVTLKYKDGEVVEQIISSEDEEGNILETTVFYRNENPIKQIQKMNNEIIAVMSFDYSLNVENPTTTTIFKNSNGVIEEINSPEKRVLTLYKANNIATFNKSKYHKLQQIVVNDKGQYITEYDGEGNTLTVVQNNESLELIARRFGVTISDLMRANEDLTRTTVLQAGQEIIIPKEFNADSPEMTRRESADVVKEKAAKEAFKKVYEKIFTSVLDERTISADHAGKNVYDYATKYLIRNGVKKTDPNFNSKVNDLANELIALNGKDAKYTAGSKIKYIKGSIDQATVDKLKDAGMLPKQENHLFFVRFSNLTKQQQTNIIDVLKYCKSKNIKDPKEINATILKYYPHLQMFETDMAVLQKPTRAMARNYMAHYLLEQINAIINVYNQTATADQSLWTFGTGLVVELQDALHLATNFLNDNLGTHLNPGDCRINLGKMLEEIKDGCISLVADVELEEECKDESFAKKQIYYDTEAKLYDKNFRNLFYKNMDYDAVVEYLEALQEFQQAPEKDRNNKNSKVYKKIDAATNKLNSKISLLIETSKKIEGWSKFTNTIGGLTDLGIQVALLYLSGGSSAIASSSMYVGNAARYSVGTAMSRAATSRFASTAAGRVILSDGVQFITKEGSAILSSMITSSAETAAFFQVTKVIAALEDGNVTREEVEVINEGYKGLFEFSMVGSAIAGPLGAKASELTSKLLNSEKAIASTMKLAVEGKGTTLDKVLKALSENSNALSKITEFGTSFAINAGYMAIADETGYGEAAGNLAQMDAVSKLVVAMLGGKQTAFLTPQKVQQIKTSLSGYEVKMSVYKGKKVYEITDKTGKVTHLANEKEFFLFILDVEVAELGLPTVKAAPKPKKGKAKVERPVDPQKAEATISRNASAPLTEEIKGEINIPARKFEMPQAKDFLESTEREKAREKLYAMFKDDLQMIEFLDNAECFKFDQMLVLYKQMKTNKIDPVTGEKIGMFGFKKAVETRLKETFNFKHSEVAEIKEYLIKIGIGENHYYWEKFLNSEGHLGVLSKIIHDPELSKIKLDLTLIENMTQENIDLVKRLVKCKGLKSNKEGIDFYTINRLIRHAETPKEQEFIYELIDKGAFDKDGFWHLNNICKMISYTRDNNLPYVKDFYAKYQDIYDKNSEGGFFEHIFNVNEKNLDFARELLQKKEDIPNFENLILLTGSNIKYLTGKTKTELLKVISGLDNDMKLLLKKHNFNIDNLKQELSFKKPTIEIPEKQLSAFMKNIIANNNPKVERVLKDFDFAQFGKEGLPLKYSRDNFIRNVQEIIKDLPNNEQTALLEHFGLDRHFDGLMNNKPMKCESKELQKAADRVLKEIENFTIKNEVMISDKEAKEILDGLIKGMPEFTSIIGKKQHERHAYSVDIHMLKVLQSAMNNPEYSKLSDKQKTILKFSALLHDVGKRGGVVDDGHYRTSAEFMFPVLEKFNLSDDVQRQIIDIVDNHHWFGYFNTGKIDARKAAVKFRTLENFEIAKLIAKADLENVNKTFHLTQTGHETQAEFDAFFKVKMAEVEAEIRNMHIYQPVLMNTGFMHKGQKFPTQKVMVNGKEVELKVLNLSEVPEGASLEEFGFAPGTTIENAFFNVHMTSDMETTYQLLNGSGRLHNEHPIISTSIARVSEVDVRSGSLLRDVDPESASGGFVLDIVNQADIATAFNANGSTGTKKSLKNNYLSMFSPFGGQNSVGNQRSFIRNNILKYLQDNVGIKLTQDEYRILVEKHLSGKKYLTQITEDIKIGDKVIKAEDCRRAVEDAQEKLFTKSDIYDDNTGSNHGTNEVSVVDPVPIGLLAKARSIEECSPEFLEFAAQHPELGIVLIAQKESSVPRNKLSDVQKLSTNVETQEIKPDSKLSTETAAKEIKGEINIPAGKFEAPNVKFAETDEAFRSIVAKRSADIKELDKITDINEFCSKSFELIKEEMGLDDSGIKLEITDKDNYYDHETNTVYISRNWAGKNKGHVKGQGDKAEIFGGIAHELNHYLQWKEIILNLDAENANWNNIISYLQQFEGAQKNIQYLIEKYPDNVGLKEAFEKAKSYQDNWLNYKDAFDENGQLKTGAEYDAYRNQTVEAESFRRGDIVAEEYRKTVQEVKPDTELADLKLEPEKAIASNELLGVLENLGYKDLITSEEINKKIHELSLNELDGLSETISCCLAAIYKNCPEYETRNNQVKALLDLDWKELKEKENKLFHSKISQLQFAKGEIGRLLMLDNVEFNTELNKYIKYQKDMLDISYVDENGNTIKRFNNELDINYNYINEGFDNFKRIAEMTYTDESGKVLPRFELSEIKSLQSDINMAAVEKLAKQIYFDRQGKSNLRFKNLSDIMILQNLDKLLTLRGNVEEERKIIEKIAKNTEGSSEVLVNITKLLYIEGRAKQLDMKNIIDLTYDRSSASKSLNIDIDKLVKSGLLKDIPDRKSPLSKREIVDLLKEDLITLKEIVDKNLLSDSFYNLRTMKFGKWGSINRTNTLEMIAGCSKETLDDFRIATNWDTALELFKTDPERAKDIVKRMREFGFEDALICSDAINSSNVKLVEIVLNDKELFNDRSIWSILLSSDGSIIRNDAFAKIEIYEQCKNNKDFPKDVIVGMMQCAKESNIEIAKKLCKDISSGEIPVEQVIMILKGNNNISYSDVRRAQKVFDRNLLSQLNESDAIIAYTFAKLAGVKNINEIPVAIKKKFVRDLVASNTGMFRMSPELAEKLPILPKTREEYCSLLPALVRSMGIETTPLTPQQRIDLFHHNMSGLSTSLAKLSDADFANLKITQEMPKEEFIATVIDKVQDLTPQERQKVYDYYGFELHHNKTNETGFSITGYPVNLNNGHKLAQITDPKTKAVVEDLRPDVIRFSKENKIRCNNPEVETFLNEIVDVMPEIRTMIGRAQHGNNGTQGSHDFDVMGHSLKVMQKISQDPKFEKLNETDKKLMLIASLMHDITKAEGAIDKTHANESSFDTFFIAKKFNLSKEEELKLYRLIKHHEWLEYVNTAKTEEQLTKCLQSVAYDLQQDNLIDLALMFTHADLKAVKADDTFHDTNIGKSRAIFDGKTRVFDDSKGQRVSHGQAADIYGERIRKYIGELQKTQPLLPVTKVPAADVINKAITKVNPDGSTNIKGVYKDSDGLVVIKFNEVEDWEAIGFPKGSISRGIESECADGIANTGNIKFFVHGLEYENQLSKFDAFSLVDSDVLLSVSYTERPESKFRFFRTQGVVLDVATENVHGGGKTDAGSGCGKFVQEFKDNYIFGGNRESDRTYVSDLIKEATGMTDEQYVRFVEENKNKEFTEIEPAELREKVIKAFATINSKTRWNGNRAYNEMYLSNPAVMAVFAYDVHSTSNVGNPFEFLRRTELDAEEISNYPGGRENAKPVSERTAFLRQYALENNLPFIIFGD